MLRLRPALLAGVLVLAGCSGDVTGSGLTTAPVVTPFRTIPKPTTTLPPTTLDPNAPTTPPMTDAAGSVITTVAGGTLPPEGTCIPGIYEIQEDDTSRLRVAEKFDMTVEELDAANEETEDYDVFYVGLDIVIPCPPPPPTTTVETTVPPVDVGTTTSAP